MSVRKDAEEPLKALVFADNCGNGDGPVVGNLTSVLNLPTLSWQLGVLARYGVKEAIVLSSKPVESMYEDPLHRMKVTTFSSQSWTNEGDAIRDVESRDDLRPADDFVLVRQGAIFNVDVSQLVAAHKRRKEEDRNWLITTVLRKGAGSASSGLAVSVDRMTGTLLKYVEKVDDRGILIDINAENSGLSAGGALEICADVMDIGLDVCAPEFLVEFRENFYYDSVRAYIKEKLEGGEAEVFGNRMYAHYLDSNLGQYGTRICSLASLSQATSDILNGWMCPISPCTINGTVNEPSTQDFQSEFLLEQSAVGQDVVIAVGSTIVESVIGNNVKIGSDVTIKQSILMDGAVIGDRSDVDGSIISAGCVIQDSAVVPRNCFLDTGVCIGSDFLDMAPHSLITLKDPAQFLGDDGSDDEEADENNTNDENAKDSTENCSGNTVEETWHEEHVGMGGKGRLVEISLSVMVDPFFVPRGYSLNCYESDEEDELEEEDDDSEGMLEKSQEGTNGEIDGLAEDIAETKLESADAEDIDMSQILKFNQEVFETIERAQKENVDVENTTLEVNSLKLVYHCSFSETLTGIVAGLAHTTINSSLPEKLYAGIDAALKKYESVILKFNKAGDATHHLQVAKGIATSLTDHGTVLMYVFKIMYDRDMLEEEGILGWSSAEKAKVDAGTGSSDLLNAVYPLLEWLEDEDSETDEEEAG